jgi:hypothetical protein
MKIPLHLLLAACAVASTVARAGIVLGNAAPGAVGNWNEVAAATVNPPPDPAGTASGQRPIDAVDNATVQFAVLDAVTAIAGTHLPFAVAPKAVSTGAPQEANRALTQKFQPRGNSAAPASSSVEVVGRLPLREACPAVDDDLPDALARAWDEVAIPGTVQVEFGLVGRRIVAVTPLQGPQRYFRYVRRAVRALACDSGVAEPRIVRFDIRFVDIRDRRGDGAQAGLALDDAAMR